VITVEIIGLRDLQGRFAAATDGGLVARLQEEAVVMSGEMARAFSAAAPRSSKPRDGHTPFADSMHGEAMRTATGFEVGVRSDQGELARMIREGTPPHEIWAGAFTGKSGAKVLYFEIDGEAIMRAHVHHPGTRPNLWEHRAIAAVDPIITFMGNRIGARVMRDLAGGGGLAVAA
jgi:hypothetical protein